MLKDYIYIVRDLIVYNLINSSIWSSNNFRVTDAVRIAFILHAINCIQSNWRSCKEYLEIYKNKCRRDWALIVYNLINGSIWSSNNFRITDTEKIALILYAI